MDGEGLLYSMFGLLLLIIYLLGVLSTIHALLTSRTPQGAIAWSLSMVMFPYLAVPLYWVFGRPKFLGYTDIRQRGEREITEVVATLREAESDLRAELTGASRRLAVLEALAGSPFTRANALDLLIDGEATFESIFEAIGTAQEYILLQFFTVRNDRIGKDLLARLVDRALAGVRVYCLLDEVGSHSLPRQYVRELEALGVNVRFFGTTKRLRNHFRLNFRNHRKIVVVDGISAFVGGLNVGDEYMGRSRKFGHWRDTHLRLSGPCVQDVQLAFVQDWHWAAREIPALNWTPCRAEYGDRRLLVVPAGPADRLETCELLFVQMIHAAQKRIWIVSPYFIPGSGMLTALQLAALRGVEVRIMLPRRPDHLLVYLASFAYLAPLALDGITFYRYGPGFLHQKVVLVDDDLAAVGTANADNRSFRLNFEITVVAADKVIATDVETMLEADFEHCRITTVEDLHNRPLLFQLGVRIARLFSPIL